MSVADLTPLKFRAFFKELEKEYFRSALESAEGCAIELANRVGIGRSTIFKKLKSLGLREKNPDGRDEVMRPQRKAQFKNENMNLS